MTRKIKESGLSCVTCAHWIEQTESGDEVRWGFCRRYPPVVVFAEEGPQSIQTWTEMPFVCGEHKDRLNG